MRTQPSAALRASCVNDTTICARDVSTRTELAFGAASLTRIVEGARTGDAVDSGGAAAGAGSGSGFGSGSYSAADQASDGARSAASDSSSGGDHAPASRSPSGV